MSEAPSLNPRILGVAERTQGAVLERMLVGAGLTFQRWVMLNLITGVAGGEIDLIVDRMADALKIDHVEARRVIEEATSARLVEAVSSASGATELRLSSSGDDLFRRLRSEVDETVARMYAGIPEGDLAVAANVLIALTKRANAELAPAA